MAQQASLFAVNPRKDFTRNRDIDFQTLLRILLSIGGNSLNKELYDYFKAKDYVPTKSAFVQQRAKLLPEALGYMIHEFNDRIPAKKTLSGYRLYAIDGSDFNISLNQESDTYFKKQPHNQLHVNVMFDVLNQRYEDLVVQPSPKQDERAAALAMLYRNALPKKSIVIMDRGYGGLNLIEHFRRMNVDYLIRVKNDIWKEVAALPMKTFDTEITIEVRTSQTNKDKEAFTSGKAKWIAGPGKYKQRKYSSWDFESPCKVTLRVVRFKISEDTYETIVTSLNRFEFPGSRIKYLYHLRWNIETSFRDLKYSIGAAQFHAKKEPFVLQEIYARILFYNFCSAVIKSISVNRYNHRKYIYQITFSMAVNILRDYIRYTGKSPPIEELLIRYAEPVRPGRRDKRKLKPKSFISFLYRIA